MDVKSKDWIKDERRTSNIQRRILNVDMKMPLYGRLSYDKANPEFGLRIAKCRKNGKMNGIEAAERIRRYNPLVPIIFLSCYEDKEALSKVSAILYSAFLSKTSAPEEIKETIDTKQK